MTRTFILRDSWTDLVPGALAWVGVPVTVWGGLLVWWLS